MEVVQKPLSKLQVCSCMGAPNLPTLACEPLQQPTGREVGWINRFLDQCCVRGLAWHTLRGYAFALLQFVRWWVHRHSTDEVTEQALTSSSLLDYMRDQVSQQPRPTANTINTRVWVAESALHCQFPDIVPPAAPGFRQSTGGSRHSAMAAPGQR